MSHLDGTPTLNILPIPEIISRDIPDSDYLKWLQGMGSLETTIADALQDILEDLGFDENPTVSYISWLQLMTGSSSTSRVDLERLAFNLDVFTLTDFGQFATWFYNSSSFNEDGIMYSKEGGTAHPIQISSPTMKGNNSVKATATLTKLSGLEFHWKGYITFPATNISTQTFIDSRDGSNFNGVFMGIQNSGHATFANTLQFGIADGDDLEINLRYPVLSTVAPVFVEIDWDIDGGDPFVRYDTIEQAIHTTVANDDLLEFTPNQDINIYSTQAGTNMVQSLTVSDMIVGTIDNFHNFTIQEGDSGLSWDITNITGSNKITWTGTLNWVVNPVCSHWGSRKGFFWDGTREIPASYVNNKISANGDTINQDVGRKLYSCFVRINFNPLSVAELVNLPTAYKMLDAFDVVIFSDKRINYDDVFEDRFLYALSDISGHAGYENYTDNIGAP